MKKHIVIFGDSNTHGFCANPSDSEDGGERYSEKERYTCLLQEMLGDDFAVYEEGMNGRTSVFEDPLIEGASGISCIVQTLQCHEPVDLLILMLGTNDTKDCFGQSGEGVAWGLRRILKKAKDTECWKNGKEQILYICPPVIPGEVLSGPVGNMFGSGCMQKSRELSGHMERQAKELGIGFIDADGCELNHVDYLHLTKKGHRQLAEKLYAVLKEKLL